MKSSMPVLFLICLFLSFAAIAQSNQPKAGGAKDRNSSAEQEIIAAARDRANALTNHQCDQWASHLADDFQDIEAFSVETRDEMLEGCRDGAKVESVCKSERELSDFHFRFKGDLAFVYYVYKITEHCGEYTFLSPHRQVDTYEKRNGKWIALYAVEALQVKEPPAAKVDPAILDEYVGQYAWTKARIVDTVTRKGDKLYIQTTDDSEPTELVPEGADVFFVRRSLDRTAFMRDSGGKVVGDRGYSAENSGQTEYSAKKIQ